MDKCEWDVGPRAHPSQIFSTPKVPHHTRHAACEHMARENPQAPACARAQVLHAEETILLVEHGSENSISLRVFTIRSLIMAPL